MSKESILTPYLTVIIQPGFDKYIDIAAEIVYD